MIVGCCSSMLTALMQQRSCCSAMRPRLRGERHHIVPLQTDGMITATAVPTCNALHLSGSEELGLLT